MITTGENGGSTQITPSSECGLGSDACIGLESAHRSAPASCSDGHEWVVFSTALLDGCLMVQCVECGTHGSFDDPTKEEWSEPYDAPSNPYRWQDESRVHIRGRGPLYVGKLGDHSDDRSLSPGAEGTAA